MATKFGYVERNIENDVNWGEVGKGFADMLVAEREERQAKKDLLDDAMIKTQDALKEAPLGYNTDFNDRIIDLASNASSYLLAANKDLKAGKLTPAEYMRKVQRMNSSADQIFTLTNNYNELYEKHLNRMDSKPPLSGAVEQAIFERIDNMTNFNENDFFIDSTGAIVAAPLVKGENGITTIDPSGALSAQAMFNLAQNFVNKLDVEGEVDTAVDKLGKYIVTEQKAATYKVGGKTVTISDITQREDYSKMRESLINGILDSDLNTASVLADYIRGYDVITDEKQLSKDPTERERQVFIDISNGKEGRAVLTKNQEAVAREQVGTLIDGMIDKKYTTKETARKERRTSASDTERYLKRKGKLAKDSDILNMMKKLWSGEKSDVLEADEYFRDFFMDSKSPTVKVGRTDEGIYVDIKDSETQQIVRRNIDFKGKTLQEFIETASPLLVGERDIKEALKKADYSKEEKFSVLGEDIFAEVTKAPSLKKDISKYVSNVAEKNNLQEDLIASGTTFVNTLKDAYADTDIEFEYDGDNDGGIISIVGSDLSVTIKGNLYTNQQKRSRDYIQSINNMIEKYMRANESAYRDIVKGEGSAEEEITEDKSGELDG